ncbi:MAG: 50S ribosomal protein L23 [Armatimonadota bacterium]
MRDLAEQLTYYRSIIIRPHIITEKANRMMEGTPRKYTFQVRRTATKSEIRKAIEHIYRVRVTKVNTMIVKGKRRRMGRYSEGRTASWKKAIVTVAPGEEISIFEAT